MGFVKKEDILLWKGSVILTRNRNSQDALGGIGSVIRSLRLIRDLSVKELADRMEISSSYICDVEANRKKPSLTMIERFSDALGVRSSTILFFDEEREKNNYNHQSLLLKILKILENN